MVGHAGSTAGSVHPDVTVTRSKAFDLPNISEAVHAGGDDCQPPCGAFWFPIVHVRALDATI